MAKAKTTSRQDVNPLGEAPQSIKKFLLKVGGKNPFGEPMFRLVQAQHVTQLEGGEWSDYPADATTEERGGIEYEETPSGLVLLGASVTRLERVIVEMRWVPRYDDLEGWMLQKWHPATEYGSREQWESFTLKNHPDVQVLGPFPVYGNYEPCSVWQEEFGGKLEIFNPKMTPHGMMGLCLKHVPPTNVLHKAVLATEDATIDARSSGATPEARIKYRLNNWVAHEAARREKRKAENLERIKDHMKPVWGSSLESARLREELAKKAGITSHVGA